MAAGEYLTGLGLLALVVGAAAALAVAIVRARLTALTGLERCLAGAVLATAALIAMHIVPAALGVLDRWTVAVLAAGALAGAASLPPAAGTAPETSAPAEHGRAAAQAVSFVLAAVAVAAVAIYALAVAARLGGVPSTFIDTTTFHLPGVGRWIQAGSIWQIDQFLPGQAQGYYPGNGNVVQLAAVLPWSSDFLVRFVNLPFYAITGLALYGSGRELGARGPAAAVTAAAAISVPAVTSYVVDSPTPDAVMYATFAAGAFFLLRHARSRARADILLAGLGLGIAFGSRWYGVSSVAIVIAGWLLAQTFARRWSRRLAIDALCMAGLIAAGGGTWLARNWVEAGNPVFPVEVSALGVTVFDAPRDAVRELVGFSISDYLGDPGVLGDFILPGLKIQLGYVGVVVLALSLAAIWAGARSRRELRGAAALCLGAGSLALCAAYVLTPYTALGLQDLPYEMGANVRYLVPALLLAAPATAWFMARSGRARPLYEAALLVVALDAIRRGVDVSAANVLVATVAAAALAGTAVAVAAAWRRGPALGLAAMAAVAVVAAAALYSLEERFLDGRYAAASAPLDAALARAPEKAQIGIAGAWPVTTVSPVLPLMGASLDNRVSYVGEWRDGMLLPFERREAFAAALERGDFDLVMIGHEKPLAFAQRPEERWARDAGFRPVAADENFTLLAAPPAAPEGP